MSFRTAGCVLTVLAVATCVAAEPLGEPPDRLRDVVSPTFGDAENVRLLASLTDDPDPLVREQAVRDLGQTHNELALEHVAAALEDEDPQVRIAAVAAAAEFAPDRGGRIILAGLGSPERAMVLEAMRAVERTHFTDAAGEIIALLQRDDPAVRLAALDTLAELGVAPPAETIRDLLSADNQAVRLAAAQAAVRLDDAGGLLGDLTRLATSDAPSVRAAAMRALGKFAYAASAALVNQALQDASPVVRRGGVWAMHEAGRKERLGELLADPSAMVRLAAIRAAGELNCIDCVDRLTELMLDAPDRLSHDAARDALAAIDTPRVAELASARLETVYRQYMVAVGNRPDPDAPPSSEPPEREDADGADADEPQREPDVQPDWRELYPFELHERNTRSCLWLLGRKKSNIAMDLQLRMIEELPIDSAVLIDLTESLGLIGDPRAKAPLKKLLDRLLAQGRRYLVAITSPVPFPLPYNESATAAAILATRPLGMTDAVEVLVGIATSKVKWARLNEATAAAFTVLPDLATDASRGVIVGGLDSVLTDENYSSGAIYMAMKAAGRMKAEDVLSPIRSVMTEQRLNRTMIRTAAWAIRSITGQTPEMPLPKVNQGEWILRKTRR